MRIVFDRPPMYDAINAKFHIAGKQVIFAWGNIIYNPARFHIPSQLVAHEEAHGARQIGDIEGWWERYIDDPAFRLAEEVVAHVAEYQYLVGRGAGNRQARRSALRQTAKRLASPLYGNVTSQPMARRLLLEAA